jgi:SRSO17 transposase
VTKFRGLGSTPHYAERTIAWPVATRLYVHESWATDRVRCTKAQVPEAVTFQTKPQIALTLLDRAKAWGVRYACVTADAD